MSDQPHRRRNMLTGRWVVVSPHRQNRPWQGEVGSPGGAARGPAHDETCHLCPGNTRATGERNPGYTGSFVFDNGFPALLPEAAEPAAPDPLLVRTPARGTARVICYSPDHSQTMADMDQAAIRAVVDTWTAESRALHRDFAYVQVFENKGAMMGCSSPHPHGQIWASDFIPSEVEDEDREQAAWRERHGTVLLDAVVQRELAEGDRVLWHGRDWLVVVPFWASWPFETLLIARQPVLRLEELEGSSRDELAEALVALTRGYDRLFGVSFPYSMGWHQMPAGARDPAAWRLHAHFYPPLLRSASVRKFMVGYEMLAEAQRDLTPEQAASLLREAIEAAGE